MLSLIIKDLTQDLIVTAIASSVRRVAEKTLQEMWLDRTREEETNRRQNVKIMTKLLVEGLVSDRVRFDVGRIGIEELRKRSIKQRVLRRWFTLMKILVKRREDDLVRLEQLRTFEQIALEGNRKGKGRVPIELDSDEESELDELDFKALSLTAVDVDRLRERDDAVDAKAAERVAEVRPALPCTA